LFCDETRCKTKTGFMWAIARDDRPWGGTNPPDGRNQLPKVIPECAIRLWARARESARRRSPTRVGLAGRAEAADYANRGGGLARLMLRGARRLAFKFTLTIAAQKVATL
jgi:hypothetical protein